MTNRTETLICKHLVMSSGDITTTYYEIPFLYSFEEENDFEYNFEEENDFEYSFEKEA